MTALASGPVQDALGDVARFVPKLILFLIILVLGWLAARLLRAGASRLLRRVGFDQAVERGGVGRVLSRTRYDARGVMTTLVYYAVLLFTLQLAFGIWGPNPVSALIAGIVAWLPRAFVAILIVVVAAAIAAGVRNVITGALRGLSYGRLLASVAGAFILAIGIIAALDQIGVATSVTTPVLVAILATTGGILVVGVGGGLVRPMQSRWESWLSRAELELPQVREQLRVAAEQREAEARAAAEREEAARLEAARLEAEARAAAEREEAARLEAEARAAAEREEAARLEQEAREAAEAEARAAELEREQEAERAREAERLQAARDEAARLEAERAEAERAEAEREEAARQDGARAEAARQEVALREAAQAEAAGEEAAPEEAAREEAARQEAAQAEAAPEEAAREEAARQEAAQAPRQEATREGAKPAKPRTSRPRTARERAEQAAEHRAAAEAGTLPQAPPSDDPTVAIPISKVRRAAAGSGQDAEQTQPITLPVTGAADDSERTQVVVDDSERTQVLPTMPEPEQKAPPSTPRRRRPQGGGASK